MTFARQGGSLAGPIARAMTWQKHSFTKVIEQIPIGVVVTLPDGTIEYANPCLCRLLGLSAAQLPRVDLAQFRAAGAVPPREDGTPTDDRYWLTQFESMGDWSKWLAEGDRPDEIEISRRHVEKGLPCGSANRDQGGLNQHDEFILRC